MKLIYFIPLLSAKGGQERTLTDKANYLVEKGHEVLFVTYEHEGLRAYQVHDAVRHIDIHCHYFSLYRLPLWRRPLALLKLKRTFRERMGRVMEEFRPDVIVVAIPNTENFLSDLMRIAGKIPVVVESHLAQGHIVIRRGFTEKGFYWLQNPLQAVRQSQLLIALTQDDAECWRRMGVPHVAVIPNPVTCYPEEVSRPASPLHRIICVGRLTPQKRYDRLIEAFAMLAEKYPSWQVDIYGAGEDEKQLRQQIGHYGLTERIHILPPVNDIYVAYGQSDFLVLSSDFEGFGLVIIEAMACGIPVVATNCPFGPADIILDGETGLLSKLEVKDLADKMEWMMTHDTERLQMGLNARQAAARYRKDVVIPQWEQAYLQAAEE
mgnify:CR=1 FL=1